MSTLTTIQATDLITNSRANINDNFAALNADKIETSVLDTDTALTANSDSKIATQKAVKAYVDAGGNVNASTTTKGIVEQATNAEVEAGTATGSTGAPLFVNPSSIAGSLGKKTVTAGATITGATLPVPVYQNKTDNEFYICDGNDTGALKFLGFATSDGVDGGSLTVQFAGIVSGFTALDEGEKYYLSDTAGTISTTPGTYEVLVGIAISTTELLIQKGMRFIAGTISLGDIGIDGATQDTVVTCGFRASRILIHVFSNDVNNTDGVGPSIMFVYTNGTLYGDADECTHDPSIVSISDTAFTIRMTQNGSNGGGDISHVTYTAEGYL